MALTRVLDVYLRGSGQVMFQNHPGTGLLFLLGIAVGSRLEVTAGALLGLIAATFTGALLKVDVRSGLYGYNGILVGATLPTFLERHPILWLYVLVGAALSSVVMKALTRAMKIPALTFPFVLVVWMLVPGAHALAQLPVLPSPPGTALPWGALSLATSVLNGISQVFLVESPWTGLLFVAGLALSSRQAAAWAVIGSLLAVFVAMLFGAEPALIQAGLFGFSPVLTAIALGCVFPARLPLVLLGTVAAVFTQAGLDVLLKPLGVPTFTAAFIFVTWLFILANDDSR